MLQFTALREIRIIRQCSALVLLLLFMVSNTPKQLLHDIFANHVDYRNGIAGNKDTAHVKQLTFHCQCDHQVVESPFLPDIHGFAVYFPFHYPLGTSSLYTYINGDHQFQFGLRGPPMV
ncbi:MAG: hypothetical protein ABI760_16970 [Ferruginibacter sp.]